LGDVYRISRRELRSSRGGREADLALYKYPNYLAVSKNSSFDQVLPAGLHIPSGGIYRCVGCGNEVAQEANTVLPDRQHHAHAPAQGEVRWQLIIATQTDVDAPYLHG
jgi:hypothetical protein